MADTKREDQIHSLNFIADVVEEIIPSVVNLKSGDGFSSLSVASGFIVSESGYVITNAHCFEENINILVVLHSGKIFNGTVEAIDFHSDLLLIKIDSADEKLKPLVLSDSNKIHMGEFVIAIGCPVGDTNSVTVGIISAVEQDLDHPEGLKYVQTDAMMTNGNSGGPLVNLYGELVGMNTFMSSVGFGFAIPSNHCRSFIELAMKSLDPDDKNPPLDRKEIQQTLHEGSKKKDMGLILGSITNQLASEIGHLHPGYCIQVETGIIIHSLFDKSPANRCDLYPGDIIESINNIPLHSPDEFNKIVNNLNSFDLVIIRTGKRIEMKNVKPNYDSTIM